MLAIILAVPGALAAPFSSPPSSQCSTDSSFSQLDADDIGVFNIGLALGGVLRSFDKAAGRDVLEFDYSLPQGSIIGVWTTNYPEGLTREAIDAVRIGVRVPNPDQLKQVSVVAEVKGKNAIQKIPLHLEAGWSHAKELIDWNMIGDLKEVVFVVSPMSVGPKGANPMWFNPMEAGPAAGGEALEGILYFDVDFYKVSFLQKNFIFVRVGLIAALGFLAAFIVAFLKRLLHRHVTPERLGAKDTASLLSRLKRDLLYGVAAVLIAGTTLGVYSAGTVSYLEACFSLGFLAVGLAGALIAGLLKFGITGKLLTPREAFRNIFLAGLLAAASSRMGVLQAPSTWNQILMFSNTVAAITFLIYHVSNARSLVSTGKHLRAVTGAFIVGIPYLFGWLLLLQNATLLQSLSNAITAGILVAWPAVLQAMGRLLVVFGFNEAVANGISLVTKSRMLKTGKAHLSIFLVSLGVVVAPLIADLGSTAAVAALPAVITAIIVILTTMFSFAGLWGEVYLITGIALDGGKRTAPSGESIFKHVTTGMRKGAAYSGILMGILYVLHTLLNSPLSHRVASALPIGLGILAGAVIFPFIKTIVETFDGSLPFFQRVRHSYRDASLLARGAIVGYGFSYAVTNNLFQQNMPDRILFGLMIGLLASSGVSILRDVTYALKGQGRLQSWRLYFTDAVLGAFVGSASAFYLDSRQVPVVIEKFKLYTSAGFRARDYITYPLVNKWGRIDLGTYTGGVKLLFTESLAGVINWSIAAWLFAINRVFMQAFFERHVAPIKFFFSKEGFAQLIEHMIYVLRWGLWMSPIIFTFLRMMPEPTWYNQDGAIRTAFAIFHNSTMSPEAFQAWSLKIFVYILAFDFFRVLIWMDHMGLRVATLVNLSFIGLDRLDGRIARFIGRATAQRYIPEAVKRFATWGPLLIPFYLPRGKAWDYAWNTSEAMHNAAGNGGLLTTLRSLTLPERLLVICVAVLACTGVSFGIRLLRQGSRRRRLKSYELQNREYKVVLKENGEIYSQVDHQKSGVFPKEYDVSRRSYDTMDPSGRTLYLVDTSEWHKSRKRYWPVVGNFPKERFRASRLERGDNSLEAVNATNGIKATVNISLPDMDSCAELWEITLENLTDKSRQLKVVPYLEWVLNGGLHDRFHTQYARLFPEMEYVRKANAILSWHKGTKAMGILAADIPPEGFLNSRVDFIGRARSIWRPQVLEKLNFLEARDTAPYPTFDPIGSLMVNATIDPGSSRTVRLLIGYATDRKKALDLIDRHLKPAAAKEAPSGPQKKRSPLIGHGEIPPGTPKPYSKYIDNGNRLRVFTPFTPRPFDHAMSNAVGHSVMVTNRGLHTSCNGNSQQNRLTPDWPDTVTRELPGEAIYLYDTDRNEWYCPTYQPLNDEAAKNESEFGVDGTAVFHMRRGSISTELTVFVPPDDPTGVYILTVKNNGNHLRRMRIAPYFQMVLEFQPEKSGKLRVCHDKASNALFFENPRNMFRAGWAFASMSIPAERVETKRGRFFGRDRGIVWPFMVEKGEPDATQVADERQIAGFLGSVEIPAHGERTIAIVLGEADERKEAARLVQKYKSVETARKSLKETRKWWLALMGTVTVETNKPEFDRLQNWLKYQALAERVWARRGFYQTSGAFGFRDQLQDTVNLIWVDPALARKQIILHASHQFLEGDVFHWFFTLTDGRTAFSCRSHASDNPLWLAWGVVEYVRATGDVSVLDEMTSYVWSEFPFADLPKNKAGWGHLYQRSTREDSVYRHCLRSIDLVLEKRTGKHKLPLIRTGDWNDGLDEIGSEGRGESVWLGLFLYYILKDMVNIIEKKEGALRKEHYLKKMKELESALEKTWRGDRYLRAIHDDGTEIGVKDSGVWEIDALTAAWAVLAGLDPERGLTVFHSALRVLERENAILLGWPALREDTKPYLGRSSKYPEGVRENGMYCHGVQWLIKAARILAERFEKEGDPAKASEYRAITYRLWLKITPVSHVTPGQIEIYGGQPNKQPADILTNFDRGRMIWNGYTGAAGWLFRQSFEGVVGASLAGNKLILPDDLDKPRGELRVKRVERNPRKSPLKAS
jgi:cyclic beta-1,2-glucan synthetase